MTLAKSGRPSRGDRRAVAEISERTQLGMDVCGAGNPPRGGFSRRFRASSKAGLQPRLAAPKADPRPGFPTGRDRSLLAKKTAPGVKARKTSIAEDQSWRPVIC